MSERYIGHIDQHFSGGDTVRDVVIGMADGLTVPFALTGGLQTVGIGGFAAAVAFGIARWIG